MDAVHILKFETSSSQLLGPLVKKYFAHYKQFNAYRRCWNECLISGRFMIFWTIAHSSTHGRNPMVAYICIFNYIGNDNEILYTLTHRAGCWHACLVHGRFWNFLVVAQLCKHCTIQMSCEVPAGTRSADRSSVVVKVCCWDCVQHNR